jgi:hypothetical protein
MRLPLRFFRFGWGLIETGFNLYIDKINYHNRLFSEGLKKTADLSYSSTGFYKISNIALLFPRNPWTDYLLNKRK